MRVGQGQPGPLFIELPSTVETASSPHHTWYCFDIMGTNPVYLSTYILKCHSQTKALCAGQIKVAALILNCSQPLVPPFLNQGLQSYVTLFLPHLKLKYIGFAAIRNGVRKVWELLPMMSVYKLLNLFKIQTNEFSLKKRYARPGSTPTYNLL